MILKLLRYDMRGATLVEFSVTLPLFLLLTFGLVQAGLLLWTQAGLQHGVEMAARCASVNYSANQLKLNQSCFTAIPSDVTDDNIAQYAAQNSYGIVPSPDYFKVINPTNGGMCGTDIGYHVNVSYPYNLIGYIFSVTLTATSCFPINVS